MGENEPTRAEEEQELVFEFHADEVLDRSKWTAHFRRHFYVAAALSAMCLIIWFFIAVFEPENGYPWFFYIPLACGYTLSFHFYIIVKRRALEFHTCFYVITSLLNFLSWLTTGWDTVWFFYPTLGLALFYVPHCVWHFRKRKPNPGFYIHASIVGVLDLMMFIIWLDVSHNSVPWWFFPVLSFNIPLIIHYSLTAYDELSTKLWKLHVLMYTNLNLLFFVSWTIFFQATTLQFPWFACIAIVWTPLLILHYYKYSHRTPPMKGTEHKSERELESTKSNNDPEQPAIMIPEEHQTSKDTSTTQDEYK